MGREGNFPPKENNFRAKSEPLIGSGQSEALRSLNQGSLSLAVSLRRFVDEGAKQRKVRDKEMDVGEEIRAAHKRDFLEFLEQDVRFPFPNPHALLIPLL